MLGKIEFEGQSVDLVDPNKQNLIAEVSTKVRDFFHILWFYLIPFRPFYFIIPKSTFKQKSSSTSIRIEGKTVLN